MFKFEFDETTSTDDKPIAKGAEEPSSKRAKQLLAARHHESKLTGVLDDDFLEIQQVNDIAVKYLSDTKAEFATLQSTDTAGHLQQALNRDLDVVDGQYEGGLKLWECALDLLLYLATVKVDWSQLTVLELGCGAGLPGIYTWIRGATVALQDYNPEVIEQWTIPNCVANNAKLDKVDKVDILKRSA
eukprot:m.66788 g.66788  ORF g.66788 m.66788 type:complete len:187 (+) comp14064_c0_seq21:2-562(+)